MPGPQPRAQVRYVWNDDVTHEEARAPRAYAFLQLCRLAHVLHAEHIELTQVARGLVSCTAITPIQWGCIRCDSAPTLTAAIEQVLLRANPRGGAIECCSAGGRSVVMSDRESV